MRILKDFGLGLGAHLKGMRFAFANKGYLPLLLLPFFLTLILYSAGFYVFTLYIDQLLNFFWTPAATEATGFMASLRWLYVHLLSAVLYILLFAIMYFAFMIIANILASPLYDMIAGRIGRRNEYKALRPAQESDIGILRTVLEEIKKAVFVLALPLMLLFIPIIGAPLSLLLAMILLAWDFLDFSLSRDDPSFAGRLRFVRKHSSLLLGFGAPLLVPFMHIALYPFAILGASLLYQEKLLAERGRQRATKKE